MSAVVDRFRRLPPAARAACFEGLAAVPGALSDVRYDFEGFWARDDQLVTVDELERNGLIIFTGPRRQGKTESACQLFNREILSGRSERPRIVGSSEADVDKTVVHGASGVMATLPPSERPRWVPSEGAAGVLRYPNGTDALCFSANKPDAMVGDTNDLILYDDVAKWQKTTADKAWKQSSASCSVGYACRLVATTMRGASFVLHKILRGDTEGVLVKLCEDLRANRFNIAEKFYRQLLAEFGGTDWYRQEMLNEDVSSTSPFVGLDFDNPPIRVLEALRESFSEVIVAVDPADGKGGDHDDWGIGAAGRRIDRHIVALDDRTGQYDDDEAGAVIIKLCEEWRVRTIVVERNRGERRVAGVIKAAHYKRRWEQGDEALVPLPEIIGVTAKEKKKIRAGPLRILYIEGVLHHAAGLTALERQQREWDPDGPARPRQDDHIDWWVHAVMKLAGLELSKRVSAGEQLDGLAKRTAEALREGRPEAGLAIDRPSPLAQVFGQEARRVSRKPRSM